jgi:uncharacterized membrane protein
MSAVWLFASSAGAESVPSKDQDFKEIALPTPFWNGKNKVLEKLESREILVSVRTESVEGAPEVSRLLMSGVGWVNRAPLDVFTQAKNFEKLPSVSEHFREVKFDEKTSRLFVISQALGYQARMLFQVRFDEQGRRIEFQVIEGHFLGLRGEIGMANVKGTRGLLLEGKTEMSVLMAHEARELPVPKFLIGFALEVVSKNVAQKMRRYLETGSAAK